MFVIGTAGHVDHGKSTLVQALTGTNPDRLAEEQRRAMTIDLGFAWLTLPSGAEVSIVDVPGHEDFVRNMLAGVGGIDLALLVVAADEGVMPQTREHLEILHLLQVPRGVVALTKADLVQDPDWLDLVREEVREELAGTTLAQAEIIPVSARTGQGLPELLAALDRLVAACPPPADVGRPRLPIDRAFTIAGFGTVVTGTLGGGRLTVGQEVELAPDGLRARIRGLQRHKTKIDVAEPGTRLAANLSGVELAALHRGQVLTTPGWLQRTRLLDVRVQAVRQSAYSLRHNMEVELFLATSRTLARLRLLAGADESANQPVDELRDGQTGWAQLQLREPVAVARGDRFVLRLPSPSATLGGGMVVDPHPRRRYRRQDHEAVARLAALASGSPHELLLQVLSTAPLTVREAIVASGLDAATARETLTALLAAGEVIALRNHAAAGVLAEGEVLLAARAWERLRSRLIGTLEEYHQAHPLRLGMPLEECRSRARLPEGYADLLLARALAQGDIAQTGTLVRLASHRVTLTPADEQRVQVLLEAFAREPFTPPSAAQAEEQVGPALLQYLIDSGQLVRVSSEVLFSREAHAQLEALLRQQL
ncbi:MAG: selenocysteine-specific translation elongation factor, partial [Anaerolineales bacterium]